MEPAEYALMDAAEDRMWWYRALHRASAGLRWPTFMARCWMPAAAPAACCARLQARAAGPAGWSAWNGPPRRRTRAPPPSQARRSRGAASTPCRSPTASFDAAVAADVLCHARGRSGAWRWPNCTACCAPAARLVVNMPAYAWLLSAHDRRVHNARRCTARQLAAMLREAGFGRVRTRYWNGLLLPLMVVQRKMLARGDDSLRRRPVSAMARCHACMA